MYVGNGNGENDGLSYYYDNNGEISKLSEWHGGIETPYNGYFEIIVMKNKVNSSR